MCLHIASLIQTTSSPPGTSYSHATTYKDGWLFVNRKTVYTNGGKKCVHCSKRSRHYTAAATTRESSLNTLAHTHTHTHQLSGGLSRHLARNPGQTNLPRAKRRGDRDIQLPEVVLQQLEHPRRPAVSLGDERDVFEVLRVWRTHA